MKVDLIKMNDFLNYLSDYCRKTVCKSDFINHEFVYNRCYLCPFASSHDPFLSNGFCTCAIKEKLDTNEAPCNW